MVNLKNIYKGWTRSLGLQQIDQSVKDLALARVQKCVKCPHAQEMWLKKFIDGLLQNDKLGSGIGCSLCSCPVNEKALVTEETCPDNRW